VVVDGAWVNVGSGVTVSVDSPGAVTVGIVDSLGSCDGAPVWLLSIVGAGIASESGEQPTRLNESASMAAYLVGLVLRTSERRTYSLIG
jgi:hypothetical protein